MSHWKFFHYPSVHNRTVYRWNQTWRLPRFLWHRNRRFPPGRSARETLYQTWTLGQGILKDLSAGSHTLHDLVGLPSPSPPPFIRTVCSSSTSTHSVEAFSVSSLLNGRNLTKENNFSPCLVHEFFAVDLLARRLTDRRPTITAWVSVSWSIPALWLELTLMLLSDMALTTWARDSRWDPKDNGDQVGSVDDNDTQR